MSIGRNEDGDESGWGSRIFRADANDLSKWVPTQLRLTTNPFIND